MANKHFTGLRHISDVIAKKHKISKKATGEFLLQFIDRIWAHLLDGNKVQVEGLGTFHYKYCTAGRYAGTPRITPPRHELLFKATKKLKHFS